VTTAAAAGFVALTLWLGNWQVNRAQEKRERQTLFEARMNDNPVQLTGTVPGAEALLYRRVRARGKWLTGRQFFIDNRIRNGRAGFHVITPMQVAQGPGVLLVNRGWIARDAGYPRPPGVAAPEGAAAVAGIATRPPARFLELSPQAVTGDVWQNLSIERYGSHTGLPLLPVVVLADTPGDGLAGVSETPDAGIAKHVEYAFTWFALATTAFVLWVVLNLKRARP